MCDTESDEVPLFIKKNINRKVLTDYYISNDIENNQSDFKYNVFIRLNAKKIKFTNISFEHCIFDNCYFNNCVFDSCDFTGCKFIASNLQNTSFNGCKFRYSTFERTQLDDDILSSEAPNEENLKIKFARSLRMNYQQIGNAKAVNKAISLELDTTALYFFKSWNSKEKYYKEKYPGFLNGFIQFLKWVEFWILDFVWGNGESILKLLRSILIIIILISIYITNTSSIDLNIGFYLSSISVACEIFLGIHHLENFNHWFLIIITSLRFICIALLTALLVKRFSRR
ncbi:pentapeptide repeat-containing protein [Acinetobacter vivianii]|uniref:pentapeptide repeat-containing protein n=1 Tax=Acinetobacter vivianii TaxID=1776742 RepID=UPI002DBD5482|nr:pentapeptide repeat-containing protein [Acinetobacter vivianii]MEB6480448.1 pentapeptide repeat-containing protein [Acinetobacter vivianii]MEB6658895.1 pentapeptide repeat-containing protein [Acinetobacter vivianii]